MLINFTFDVQVCSLVFFFFFEVVFNVSLPESYSYPTKSKFESLVWWWPLLCPANFYFFKLHNFRSMQYTLKCLCSHLLSCCSIFSCDEMASIISEIIYWTAVILYCMDLLLSYSLHNLCWWLHYIVVAIDPEEMRRAQEEMRSQGVPSLASLLPGAARSN